MNIIGKLGKIGKKIYLYMLVCAIAALLGISGFEIAAGYVQGREFAEVVQGQMAAALSKEILGPLKEVEKGMTLSTHSKGILEQGITDRFKFYLEKLLKNYPAIFEASAVDGDGNEVVVASRIRTTSKQDLKNRAQETFFKESMNGRIYYSDVFYKYGSKPFITISLPITLFGGKTIGVLVAETDLLDLQKIISTIKIGKEGYAYLVDNQGFVIAHPSLAVAFSRHSMLYLDVIKRAAAEPGKIHHAVYKNPMGQNVLGSAKGVENLGWVLVVAQPTKEVYAQVRRSFVLFLGALLTLAAVVTFLTYRLSRRIASPILQLNDAAGKIASGDLNVRVDIKTGDEIEALGERFNGMADSLNGLYQNMEQRISDRTRDVMLLFSFTSAVSQSLQSEEIIKIAGKELIFAYELNAFVTFLYKERSVGDPFYENIAFNECAKTIHFLSDTDFFEPCLKERKSITIDPLSFEPPLKLYDVNNALMKIIALFPIFNKGTISGFMILFSDKKEVITPDLMSMTDTCLLQLGVGIANAELYKQTQELSLTDPLTKLHNRRFFEIKMDYEFTRYKRYNRDGSLVMLDIDHFKKINDTYGHQSGDKVLQQLGEIISEFLRKSDIPTRYGGEEFALLLPETSKDNACLAAERLRKKIESFVFKIDVAPYEIKLTVSLGSAGMEPDMESWDELIKKADNALYTAKESGRNRVCCG